MATLATTQALPAVTDGLLAHGRRSLTLGLVLTVTLVASESLAVSTVMPLVTSDLGGLDLYGWAFSAFFLGSLIGIVVVGGALDRGGLTLPLTVGLGLFAAGLLVGGLAPSMPVLVAGRFLQGLGAGAVPPTAYVAIARSLPETLRPRMFAVLSTAWVIPGVVGPSAAAIVGETVGWRWVFLGLLPLVLLAGIPTIAALRRVPRPAMPSGDATEARHRRVVLALLVAFGAAVALAGLTLGGAAGLALAVAGLALLLPAYRTLSPAGTLRLAAGVPAAVLLRGILTFTFFCADAYVPYLLVEARGLPAWTAGVAYTAATLTWTSGSWLQARWAARATTRRFVGTGFVIVMLGIVVTVLAVGPGVPWPVAAIGWGIAGLGMGLAYSPLSLVVLRDSAPAEQGRSTAALQLSDTLGVALGTGVAGALVVLGGRLEAGGLDVADLSGAALGVVLAFGLGLVSGLLGRIATVRLPDRPTVSAPTPVPVPAASDRAAAVGQPGASDG